MALRITKSTDVVLVESIVATIYSNPGLGKTTLAFTADAPLLIDFDKGSHRAKNRGDSVRPDSWADVVNMTAEDLAPYRTIVVDTGGRALDCLSADIIAENPKMGRGGSLTLQGYGELKSQFTGWLRYVRNFGLDVVLICHMNEERKGDEVIERLDMQGASKNEIYKSADVMGRLYLQGNKRILNFSPTDTAFGKNPAQLPPLEVPNYTDEPNFLGLVLRGIKKELNQQSVEQQVVATLQVDWKAKVDQLQTLEQFNSFLASDEKPDERVHETVKRMLAKAAKSKGFAFDAKAGAFVVKQQKAA